MSRESHLPNSIDAAKEYFGWLIGLGVFEKIFLSGSRSPLREKKVHEHSDWDFVGLTSIQNLNVVRPRPTGQMHADLGIVTDLKELHPKAVEIWPNDEYGVFG